MGFMAFLNKIILKLFRVKNKQTKKTLQHSFENNCAATTEEETTIA